MIWNCKSTVTFEESDEIYFIWYYAIYLPEGLETRENSPLLDRMHQVQYGRVAGHSEYGSQYYFDIMTVTLDTELTTHYKVTKSIRDRSSIRCLYTKKNYNIARQSDVYWTVHHCDNWRIKKPTRCHLIFYCTSYRLNMFQAILCPSSRARDYDVDYRNGSVVLGLLCVGRLG